jgi:hypothetical protein
MTKTPSGITGLDGGLVTLTSAQLDDLELRVEGLLLCTDDVGWDDYLLIWNGMVARIPRSSSSRPLPTTSLRLSGTGKA